MASNPDFNVMTLVLGSAESDEAYTDYVWSILGSVFHHLVDDTLVCAGDPKATYRTVRKTAMLDNQVEGYTLRAELWLRAASEPTKTKY